MQLPCLSVRCGFRTEKNVSVGLCLAEDPMAEAIAAGLSQRESVFEFIVFEKESELRKALETAEIDSGFLFSEEFEEKVKKGCSKELITFLRTPFSAKGTVAKETLYAVFLENTERRSCWMDEKRFMKRIERSCSVSLGKECRVFKK